jgi:hypothetical protein
LQHVPSFCDYKVWIDTERGAEAISYLYSITQLNMMEEEFYTRTITERNCATYFFIQREMDREHDKEKLEERA